MVRETDHEAGQSDMSFTNAGSAAVLNAVFRGSGTPLSRSGSVFLGLAQSATPGQTGTVASVGEISGTGYARLAVGTSQPVLFSIATAGQVSTITNSSTITFSQAGSSWGSVGGAFIVTSLSGNGTVLFVFNGMTPRIINSGDTLSIPAGDLVATLD